MRDRVIRISGEHYQELRAHLFPGDGCEAVALGLCGRLDTPTTQGIMVQKLLLIPYDLCHERSPIRVSWPAGVGWDLYAEAMAKHLAILKIHSHPTHYADFSETDDFSDQELFSSLHGWTDDGLPHASAIMMEGGDMIARFITSALEFNSVDRISVAGDNLLFFDLKNMAPKVNEAQLRTTQTFGDKTVRQLASLSVGVVGCSGTGSWIVEQLSRLGVGRIVLVDPDVIEEKNLNRIINTRRSDAILAQPKVTVLAKALLETGLVGEVVPLKNSCFSPAVIKALASCDILFGCMDTHDGRDFLNRLATFYCLPYFDVGIHLNADGKGGVSVVCGSVHYLLPGGSSLLSRGVYTPENLRAASLKQTNPEQFQKEQEEGYIKGVVESSPAVVSINGQCATMAINNFLARIHPFRADPNSEIRWQTFDLVNSALINNPDGPVCKLLAKYIGRGDMEPPLDYVIGS